LAKNGKKRIRALWLQVHKWIGLTLAVLIIPISLTGSALVWHDWVDSKLEPQRHAVLGPALLPPASYEAAARTALAPNEKLQDLRFDGEGRPVVATAVGKAVGDGRPARTSVWLDPRDASLIERESGNGGILQVMHVLHGSLMVPGSGRTIVGWVGVFMFVSCLTGLWLWWPLSGSLRSGFRWKRRNTTNANLHYAGGVWVLIPLAMLSLTGAWISFPKLFAVFDGKSVAAPAARATALRAQPLDSTGTSLESALAAAGRYRTGDLVSIGWPTDQKAEWKIAFEREGGPATVRVEDSTGKASPAPPPQAEALARTMRRWHDGTGMGPIWQIVIFLGGIIPAILSVTGLIIWWRARVPRSRAQSYRRAAAAR
jgi:uncharacterized iron-regulated membrane protein